MSRLLLPAESRQTATTTAMRDDSGRPPEGERHGHTGGAEGTRTPDPHTASVVRYQLRHSPLPVRLVGPNRAQLYRPGAGGPRRGGGARRKAPLPQRRRCARSALLELGDPDVVPE